MQIRIGGTLLLAGLLAACGSQSGEEDWTGTYMMAYCFAQEPESADYQSLMADAEMALEDFVGEDRAEWQEALGYDGDAVHALLRFRLGEDGGLQDGARFYLEPSSEGEPSLHMEMISESRVRRGDEAEFTVERETHALGPVDRSEEPWTVSGEWTNHVDGVTSSRVQMMPTGDNPGGYPRLEILDMSLEERNAEGEEIGWGRSPVDDLIAGAEREGYQDDRICYLPTRYWTE